MNNLIINENENKLVIINKDSKITAKRNSKLDIITMNSKSNKEVFVEENSEVNFYEVLTGNSSSEIIINLDGKNSRTNTYSLFFGTNNDEILINVKAIHNNEQTHANLICKGILDGKAKLNYSGKIRVEKGAKNSQGYQKQDTLILSKNATADSIPKLEIFENEVKCSHGVTLSNINEDQLFYLTSRGINEEQAKKEIIKGFLQPILDKIESQEIKTRINQQIKELI